MAFIIRELFMLTISTVMITSISFVYIPKYNGNTHSTKTDELLLKMTVVSDCHIAGNEFETTYKNFKVMLKDIANTKTKDDVTLFLGDNTNGGSLMESFLFYSALRRSDLEGPFVMVPGNHDTGNDSGVYDERFPRFQYFNKNFLDVDVPAPYYYRVINGYYFIVLSSEDNCCHDPIMTDVQLNWFDEIMAEAGESGKPIFVLSHHHYTKYAATKSKLYKILQKYENVFYFYGHTHKILSDNSVRTEGTTRKFIVLNVPSLRLNSEYEVGYKSRTVDAKRSNIGYQVEVYSNKIIFRPRNFLKSSWSTKYEETFTLSA